MPVKAIMRKKTKEHLKELAKISGTVIIIIFISALFSAVVSSGSRGGCFVGCTGCSCNECFCCVACQDPTKLEEGSECVSSCFGCGCFGSNWCGISGEDDDGDMLEETETEAPPLAPDAEHPCRGTGLPKKAIISGSKTEKNFHGFITYEYIYSLKGCFNRDFEYHLEFKNINDATVPKEQIRTGSTIEINETVPTSSGSFLSQKEYTHVCFEGQLAESCTTCFRDTEKCVALDNRTG